MNDHEVNQDDIATLPKIEAAKPSKPRGAATFNAEQRRAFSSKGGKAAHASGTAHKFTPEEARAAGQKGGRVTAANRAHMSEIGKRGAASRAERAEEPSPYTVKP